MAENSPALQVDNSKIKVVSTYNGEEEAGFIAQEIENSHHDGYSYSQIAVLVRTAAQTRILEEKFISEAIPYQVIGGQKFYERAEIRDIIAYLRVILQPSDDLALERIINKPARGIGAKTVEKFQEYARSKHISLYQAISELIENGSISGKAKNSISELWSNFDHWREMTKDENPNDIVEAIIQDSGYWQSLKEDNSAEAPGRMDNLRELVNVMSDHDQYPDLSAFMEHVSLVMDNDEDTGSNKVRIITLHSAKGLEFDVVFLPGWEEGLFPHQRSIDEGMAALEEERRLAYVAITRAKYRLFISMAFNRKMFAEWKNNIPSRFIDELPAEHIELINKCSYFTSNRFNTNSNNNHRSYDSYEDSYSDGSGRYQYTRPKLSNSNLGKKVIHPTFGKGTIVAQDGNAVQVCFDEGGIKKIMCNYLQIVG